MKANFKGLFIALPLGMSIFTACTKDLTTDEGTNKNVEATQNNTLVSAATTTQTLLSEDFESGSKTAYATGTVSLTSGVWTLDDALIGTSTSDLKDGSKSVRIRNTGSATMGFDVTNSGSSSITVSVLHATYGTDASSTWQLWVSTDGGNTYSQTGNSITTGSTLQTATFTLNATSSFRISIRKASGGTNRINIDDVTITTSSSTGGSGGSVPGDNDNMLMGNPSSATADVNSPNNYLMKKTYYSLSYSRDNGKPNWVSWHVGASDLGSQSRANNFRADSTLPSAWYWVSNTSYTGSGFDRGHNCPSGDRTSTATANSATFLMSNMMPQAPNNNQQTWANLENYTRSLVTAGSEVYIICGSYGQGGTGSNGGVTNTIDNGHVVVPSNIWKVIVVLAEGNNDLSRVTSTTRVIAVNTPNANSINTDWKTYRTTVRTIETATGYNLLSNLPQTVQDAVETKVDNQ